ncbi:MAG: protein-export membrane protein SecF [Dehalococcoidia bacterium]|nr:MAG: protein-export membrane protein SecF [Dehalococcoidia bacterium]
MLDFVAKRNWYYLLSLLFIIPGVISLLIPPALVPGIEFTSGTTFTIQFSRPVAQDELRAFLAQQGFADAIIQRSGTDQYLIRTRTLREEVRDESGNLVEQGDRERVLNGLNERFGETRLLDYNSVSPTIATETVRNAAIAVGAASIAILLYIAFAFRQVSNPFRYGVCAIIAMLHDVLVVLGIFSILGKLAGIEVDSMFITAMLTVIGFSVHDTIVVFDRIRENLKRHGTANFPAVVNHSIMQTIGRSINTSVTVILTLLALYLFGGTPTRTFVLALLIGIISGTYSSIFNAAQLLVTWEEGDIPRLFRRLRGQRPEPQPAS